MMVALTKGTKGDKGALVPWADPKVAPWYDPGWSKGEAGPDDHNLIAMGEQAKDLGFSGMTSDLVARHAFNEALKAARMKIWYGQWTAAMGRIMHAMAVHGCLGPPRASPSLLTTSSS